MLPRGGDSAFDGEIPRSMGGATLEHTTVRDSIDRQRRVVAQHPEFFGSAGRGGERGLFPRGPSRRVGPACRQRYVDGPEGTGSRRAQRDRAGHAAGSYSMFAGSVSGASAQAPKNAFRGTYPLGVKRRKMCFVSLVPSAPEAAAEVGAPSTTVFPKNKTNASVSPKQKTNAPESLFPPLPARKRP